MTVTDVSTTCAVVIFRDKVSCITSIDGILKTLVIDLISKSCYWSSVSLAVMVLGVIGAFRLMPSTNVIQLTLSLKMTTAESLSTKVLFRTTFTRRIMLHLFMK